MHLTVIVLKRFYRTQSAMHLKAVFDELFHGGL